MLNQIRSRIARWVAPSGSKTADLRSVQQRMYAAARGSRLSFLSGANNQIFYPESAQRTRAWLASHNDPSLYDQIVIPGYAHMDLFIGRHAARDVAPTIVEQLDRHN